MSEGLQLVYSMPDDALRLTSQGSTFHEVMSLSWSEGRSQGACIITHSLVILVHLRDGCMVSASVSLLSEVNLPITCRNTALKTLLT